MNEFQDIFHLPELQLPETQMKEICAKTQMKEICVKTQMKEICAKVEKLSAPIIPSYWWLQRSPRTVIKNGVWMTGGHRGGEVGMSVDDTERLSSNPGMNFVCSHIVL
ncbi:uncharacterized protein LOC131995187 isoform X2 [Stomoxys calcitrans]|uniref:uncharacterized protein LOC131995187 isoform X2 n=1 Tax=Stomoxys calcitrans TaxID=35570 RepID=UPI0027E3996A|nr:uncharacterized protein LOC131995187 isoform X2 [Stomoxys calcitrans]